jgi:hypothetical protein
MTADAELSLREFARTLFSRLADIVLPESLTQHLGRHGMRRIAQLAEITIQRAVVLQIEFGLTVAHCDALFVIAKTQPVPHDIIQPTDYKALNAGIWEPILVELFRCCLYGVGPGTNSYDGGSLGEWC